MAIPDNKSPKEISNGVRASWPEQEPANIKTNVMMCIILSKEEICKSYSDQTGNISITSSRDNKYVCVFYHYAINSIVGHAIKSKNTSGIYEARQAVFDKYE